MAMRPIQRKSEDFPWLLAYVWAALRFLSGLWATWISPLRPLTEREQLIPIWPPVKSFWTWWERVWIAPWQRWDAIYYIWIASRGYRLDDGTAQFHPLFPWLAKPLVWLGLPPLLALLLVSSAAALVLVWAFYRLARLDFDRAAARTATLMLLTSPFAFALFVPYPESLFLLGAVGCLYWARQQKWGVAGFAGALTVLTRQQGIFLLFPVAWELWESCDRDWGLAFKAWRHWLALAWIPGGYGFWVLYRAFALNDLTVKFDNLHMLTYSLLISPSASQVVPVQTFMWPWRALYLALAHMWRAPDVDIAVNLVLGFYFLVLLVLVWKNLRVSYRIYTLIIMLVSFAYHTGTVHPYMGLPRHLLLAFPVFLGLAPLMQRRRVRLIHVVAGVFGLFFLWLLYLLEAWIP